MNNKYKYCTYYEITLLYSLTLSHFVRVYWKYSSRFCSISFLKGCGGWTWYLYTLMLTRYTMKYVVQKLWKTCDKYRIVGATALDPQNKIKRIYSFECSARCCNPSGNGPITSASPPPRVILRSTFTRRSHVPRWKFMRPIMRSIMSLFVGKLIDARR